MSARRTEVGLPKLRGRYLAAVSAVIALTLAACGSNSAALSGSQSTNGAANAAAVAAAKQAVQKLVVRPTTLNVPALSSKPAPGKTIDFIACGVASCQQYVPILKQATDAVGWNLKVINSGLTPQTIAAAYDQAVRDKPAGVIGSGGISPDVFAKQLKQLKNLGVPVVLQVVPPSTLPGLTAIVYGQKELTKNGQQMADYISADSGGHDVHLAIVSTPATPVYGYTHAPLVEAMGPGNCNSCSVDTFSFPISDLGPNLPSKVVSYLRAHPEVNYVFFDFANEVDGVPSALARAGLAKKVKIVTIDIQSTQAEYMKADQNLIATAANAWPEILWTEVGIILSASLGSDLEAAKSVEFPMMTLTKDNLIDSNGEPYFPLVADYQQIFKKAWQVG